MRLCKALLFLAAMFLGSCSIVHGRLPLGEFSIPGVSGEFSAHLVTRSRKTPYFVSGETSSQLVFAAYEFRHIGEDGKSAAVSYLECRDPSECISRKHSFSYCDGKFLPAEGSASSFLVSQSSGVACEKPLVTIEI